MIYVNIRKPIANNLPIVLNVFFWAPNLKYGLLPITSPFTVTCFNIYNLPNLFNIPAASSTVIIKHHQRRQFYTLF